MTVWHKRLARRIPELQKRFLPPVRPLGDYTRGEQDYVRAFIVLAHAEFESYFEGLSEFLWEALFDELSSFSPATPLVAAHADRIFNGAIKTITDNHGLKATNIRALLEPFGIRASDLENVDPAFLTKFSSFGVLRGQVAHQAVTLQVGAKKALDVGRIQKTTADLTALVASLDKLAEKRVASGLLLFK